MATSARSARTSPASRTRPGASGASVSCSSGSGAPAARPSWPVSTACSAISIARGGGGFGSGFVRQQASQQRDYLRQALLDNGCGLPSSGWAGGGYRTLCVRTCDGFYFPISYSVGQGRFKTDQVVCKAMYGGAEADLYVHNNGSTAEQAVSLAGRPYTAEPFAFQFRQGYNASCAAELHAGLKSLGAVFAANMASQKAADEAAARATPIALRAVPVPIARIAWSQDPETLANLAGDFRMEDQAPPDAGAPDATVADGSTAIRKLGSEYYYVQPVTIEGLGKRKPKATGFDFVGTAHAEEAPASREAPEPDPTVIR